MNFRGAQPFFDFAFGSLLIYQDVDRYDIRSPSAGVGNHPASRVVDVGQQITGVYRKILWDCGNLYSAFADGSGYPDKSDDTGMLVAFLDSLQEAGGVYLCGDDVAREWSNFVSASAGQLRAYMGYTVTSSDYRQLGGVVAPLVVGETGSMFDSWGADSLIAHGGCPLLNDFDVLAPSGAATLEASYHGNGSTAGAIVAQKTANATGQDVGFVLSGFGFQYTRDIRALGVPARAYHLRSILFWLGNIVGGPVGAGAGAYVNSLDQNYPNPFNPTTTIHYSIAESGRVTLRVYNVAGKLVRTLVDEEQSPETAYRAVTWDGRNQDGHAVSSGVYFYKLSAKGFNKT
ncbi:MAG: T9SS type A sorting domain-containing protein, partial [Candidatus Krumholzibacteria bacterium]|nr:T9SS type A sorting domain-containing protein [Candidatus Krumholzibacteria bacterium]